MENKIIYFMRHGHYGSERLTKEGKLQVRNSAQEIKEELNGTKRIRIYSSPKIRAKQSAKIIADTLLPVKAKIQVKEKLDSCNGGVGDLVSTINSFPAIIVGHQPDLRDYLGKSLSEGEYVKIVR